MWFGRIPTKPLQAASETGGPAGRNVAGRGKAPWERRHPDAGRLRSPDFIQMAMGGHGRVVSSECPEQICLLE